MSHLPSPPLSRRSLLGGVLGAGALGATGLLNLPTAKAVDDPSSMVATYRVDQDRNLVGLHSRTILAGDIGRTVTLTVQTQNAVLTNEHTVYTVPLWVTVPDTTQTSTSTTFSTTVVITSSMVGKHLCLHVWSGFGSKAATTATYTGTIYFKNSRASHFTAAAIRNPSPPQQAKTAGFTKLSFHDDFSSPTTIDTTNTGASGYKWYVSRPNAFGWPDASGKDVSVSNSTLIINPATNAMTNPVNWNLSTMHPETGNGFTMYHGYAEATIKLDPTGKGGDGGWPSWWMVSAAQARGAGRSWSTELDIMEFFDPNYLNGTAHTFFNIGQTNFTDVSTSGSSNGWPNCSSKLTNFNWDTLNKFGLLWRQGRLEWYVNDVLQISLDYGPNTVPVAWPNNWFNPLPVGSFANIDNDTAGQTLILGTGTGWPMLVKEVNVWTS